ncbi:unnamed protein product [Discosporangium mesarthrocarpum]
MSRSVRTTREGGGITVLAVPCTGDGGYLLRQMKKTDRESGAYKIFPEVVEPGRKDIFGEPRAELLQVWRELKEAGLFVDLLYAARAWEVILEGWEEEGLWREGRQGPSSTIRGGSGGVRLEAWEDEGQPLLTGGQFSGEGEAVKEEEQLMYIHCGGLEGVSSMLTRYKHMGLVDGLELQ